MNHLKLTDICLWIPFKKLYIHSYLTYFVKWETVLCTDILDYVNVLNNFCISESCIRPYILLILTNKLFLCNKHFGYQIIKSLEHCIGTCKPTSID